MNNILKWTDRAMAEYEKLLEYLYEEWSEEIAQRVITEINYTVLRIKNSPEQFQIFNKRRKVRRCVASAQTSIFFKIKKDCIEILSVFDNRQSPRKRKL
jgi:plasmid stabilization system protein ParE